MKTPPDMACMASFLVVCLLPAGCLLARDAPRRREIPLLPDGVRCSSARVTPAGPGGRLRVEFQPADWPHMRVLAPAPWDWRDAGGLALDLTNPGGERLSFGVRVDDDLQANGRRHCRTASGTLDGGETATFFLSLAGDPMDYGMLALPAPAAGLRSLKSNWAPLDLSHIVAFQIFLQGPEKPETLIVNRVEVLPAVPLERIVDPYGQYAGADWPGKLKAEGELRARRMAEEEELKAQPPLPGRDAYGGWAGGPELPGTGWFRTVRAGGKWWLVTPAGRLFFSTGIDVVSPAALTATAGREKLFSWLPGPGEPLSRHAGVTEIGDGPVKQGAAFDFYAANLERKYGSTFEAAWMETALKRLPAWGFNTIGNWSDERLWAGRRIPYVASGGVRGSFRRIGRMPDPFDSDYALAAETSLTRLARRVKDDPWCLGYFIDNELGWAAKGTNGRYALAYATLSQPAADSPAKRAFLAQLKGRYATVAALNAAWGTSYRDWTALEAPCKAPEEPGREMQADLSAFLLAHARKYFATIRDILKRHDPNHLYLGCRFAHRSPEAVQAAGEFCDVVSFNIYRPRLDPEEWAFLKGVNRPCIIGEFHFGAQDRGMFSAGLVDAGSQEGRARMYREYVESVLEHPSFVGCHWFKYVDQPITGRVSDGENYNIGFVDVTDTPYSGLAAAARSVHRTMYERRSRGLPGGS
jgi:glycosyl hydrolase family 42 (putative beta-galactosidase)